jgi:hypothetical protein
MRLGALCRLLSVAFFGKATARQLFQILPANQASHIRTLSWIGTPSRNRLTLSATSCSDADGGTKMFFLSELDGLRVRLPRWRCFMQYPFRFWLPKIALQPAALQVR